MASGLLNAASAVPEEERRDFLIREYCEFKRGQKRKRRCLSFEAVLEDCAEFEDGLADSNPDP